MYYFERICNQSKQLSGHLLHCFPNLKKKTACTQKQVFSPFCIFVSSNMVTLLTKKLKDENKVSNNLKRRVVVRAAVILRRWMQKAALFH